MQVSIPLSSINNPLVSVLMTAYNREQFIAEAIESVLASSYDNFELIIVDDCSKDETVSIAKHYEEMDHRIRLFVNEQNMDQFPNRNRAAGYARGELLMSVDSDDTMKADAIEYIVSQFTKFPNAKFATIYGQPDITEVTCLPPDENIRKHFFNSSHLHVGPGGTIIRTEYFREIGGFPETYGPAGDSYYNIKAAASADTLLLPYFYYNYRVHDNQENARKDSYLLNHYRCFQDVLLLPELAITMEEKQQLLSKSRKDLVSNMWVYLKETGDVKRIREVWGQAGLGMKGIFIAFRQLFFLLLRKFRISRRP